LHDFCYINKNGNKKAIKKAMKKAGDPSLPTISCSEIFIIVSVNLAGGPNCLIFMKWSAVYRGEKNAPFISITPLTILTRAVGDCRLSGDSSPIRTITPKEDLALTAAAIRKEE
jgi:hypothetical protein